MLNPNQQNNTIEIKEKYSDAELLKQAKNISREHNAIFLQSIENFKTPKEPCCCFPCLKFGK